jgi:hypothetical protein
MRFLKYATLALACAIGLSSVQPAEAHWHHGWGGGGCGGGGWHHHWHHHHGWW